MEEVLDQNISDLENLDTLLDDSIFEDTDTIDDEIEGIIVIKNSSDDDEEEDEEDEEEIFDELALLAEEEDEEDMDFFDVDDF